MELETVDHQSEFGKAPVNRADSCKTLTFFGPGSLILWQLQLKSAMESHGSPATSCLRHMSFIRRNISSLLFYIAVKGIFLGRSSATGS
jgi:hypothetical protein